MALGASRYVRVDFPKKNKIPYYGRYNRKRVYKNIPNSDTDLFIYEKAFLTLQPLKKDLNEVQKDVIEAVNKNEDLKNGDEILKRSKYKYTIPTNLLIQKQGSNDTLTQNMHLINQFFLPTGLHYLYIATKDSIKYTPFKTEVKAMNTTDINKCITEVQKNESGVMNNNLEGFYKYVAENIINEDNENKIKKMSGLIRFKDKNTINDSLYDAYEKMVQMIKNKVVMPYYESTYMARDLILPRTWRFYAKMVNRMDPIEIVSLAIATNIGVQILVANVGTSEKAIALHEMTLMLRSIMEVSHTTNTVMIAPNRIGRYDIMNIIY